MLRERRLHLFAIVVLFVLHSPRVLVAQHWVKCDTGYHGPNGFKLNPNGRFGGNMGMSPYFVNAKIGFTYEEFMDDNGSAPRTRMHSRLYRTTDSAKTWQLCDTFSIEGAITSMYFPSVAHGYLSAWHYAFVNGIGVGGGVYETFDTGSTWQRILRAPSAAWSVCTAHNTVIALGGVTTATGDSGGVIQSTDDGHTWDIEHSATFFGTGLTTDGNGLVVATCSQNNYDTSFVIDVTKDGGANWKSYNYLHPQNQSNFGTPVFCLPHGHALLWFVGEYDGARLLRSFDLDKGWDTILRIPIIDGWAELEGAGCAVYAGGMAPWLYRTTDDGNSLTMVRTPTGYRQDINLDPRKFSVTGNGSTVYIIDDSGFMWRTTDGGDGTMANYILYSIALSSSLPAGSSGDTIFSKLCDSTALSFSFQYTGACNVASLDSVHIEGLDSNEYHASQTHHLPSENKPDTSWISIAPTTAGTRPIVVHAIYLDDDKQFLDSSFALVLCVSKNPSHLDLFAKPQYDFGTYPLCTTVTLTDSFRVTAHGCDAVIVDSIVFRAGDSSAKDFTFTNSKSFVASSGVRTFKISFTPSQPRTDSGAILIYSYDGVTRRTDTIPVRGAGVADTRSFVARPCNIVISLCDTVESCVSLVNTTCGELSVDSITLPPGLVLPPGPNLLPQLPLALPQNEQHEIVIHFTSADPPGPDTLRVIAHMRFIENGVTIQFDTLLLLPAQVTPGLPASSFSSASLEFGSVSTCGMSKSLPVWVASVGCDTLFVTGYRVSGAGFRGERPFKSALLPNHCDTTLFTFTPAQPGEFFDTLMIETNVGEQRIPLHGTGIRGGKYIASSIASADLGTIYACQLRDTVLWLKNPGCATLAVKSGSFSNASFSSDLTYPILIKAGDSAIVHVHVAPDTSGHPLIITGTFSLASDADTGRAITIPLQVNIVYPAHLSISLSSAQTAGADKSVTFSVSLAGAAPGLSALHFDLSNDDNLLSFVSASIPGVNVTGPTTGGPIGATRHFTLSPVPLPGVIGTVTFHSFLSTDSSTPLALSAVSFDNSAGVANDCIASVDDAGSSFQYHYSCGDGLIQALMESGTFKVDRIVPNPAKDEIRVYYTTTNPILLPEGERKSIEFKMYDVLGQLRIRGEELELGDMISLDISDVPSGVYYLQIRIGASAVTKRVVVAR